MNMKEKQKSVDDAMEGLAVPQNPPVECKSEPTSQDKEAEKMVDNKVAENKTVNMTELKIQPPKRSLRERKPRASRSGDLNTKCHICEKNSLKVTLIP